METIQFEPTGSMIEGDVVMGVIMTDLVLQLFNNFQISGDAALAWEIIMVQNIGVWQFSNFGPEEASIRLPT